MESHAGSTTARPAHYWTPPLSRRAAILCATLLTAAGLVIIARWGREGGFDFGQFYYPAGQRYLRGMNPYVSSGDPLRFEEAKRGLAPPVTLLWHAMTPLGCAAAAPFAIPPPDTARILWQLTSLAFFVIGCWLALAVIFDWWPAEARWLAMSVILLSSAVRWNLYQTNVALLSTSGCGLFLFGVLRQRKAMILLGSVLAWLKPTLFLPVLVTLPFARRAGIATAAVCLIASLEVVAALRIGPALALASFRLSVANYASPGTNNDANARAIIPTLRGEPRPPYVSSGISPSPYNNASRFLHWKHLFSAFAPDMAAASLWAAAISAAGASAVIYVLILLHRSGPSDDGILAAFALTTVLGLLIVTHLRYDVVAAVWPICIAFRFALRRVPGAGWFAGAVVVGAFLCSVLMAERPYRWWIVHVAMPGDRVWLVPMYSYAVTALFCCLLIGTWRMAVHTGRSRAEEDGADIAKEAPPLAPAGAG